MICFKCGRQGHKEDACLLDKGTSREEDPQRPVAYPVKDTSSSEVQDHNYGSWMLVKKPARRTSGRSQMSGTRTRG